MIKVICLLKAKAGLSQEALPEAYGQLVCALMLGRPGLPI